MTRSAPRSVKSIYEQLRKRADYLDKFCHISNADVYRELADLIQSGIVFLPHEDWEKLK